MFLVFFTGNHSSTQAFSQRASGLRRLLNAMSLRNQGLVNTFLPPLDSSSWPLPQVCMSHVYRTIHHIYKIPPPPPLPAPSAASQNCLSLARAISVVGGPQLYGEEGEDGAQRDGGASEAAAAGGRGATCRALWKDRRRHAAERS